MKKISTFGGLLLASPLLFAQSSEMAIKVFKLINEARTNPQGFYKNYREKIESYKPAYAAKLKNEKPIPAVLWDAGLEKMTKCSVEENNLNPEYNGSAEICGFSSGRGGTGTPNLSIEAFQFVCDMYTNVHDEEYTYFAIYFNNKLNKYSYVWGNTCNRKKMEFHFNEMIDSSKVDFQKLNTAAGIKYMNEAEKRMLLEINFVRAYPNIYAKIVAHYLDRKAKSWQGLYKDEYDAGLELIQELNSLSPLPVLQPKLCIYNAAKLHGEDNQRRGYSDHTGSDGRDPWDRILKQCKDLITGSENMESGLESPREALIALLIDDGITSRGHRRNILDPRWKYAACYKGYLPPYGTHWVQNFGY
jgi:uncharacterized protein YkwD